MRYVAKHSSDHPVQISSVTVRPQSQRDTFPHIYIMSCFNFRNRQRSQFNTTSLLPFAIWHAAHVILSLPHLCSWPLHTLMFSFWTRLGRINFPEVCLLGFTCFNFLCTILCTESRTTFVSWIKNNVPNPLSRFVSCKYVGMKI